MKNPLEGLFAWLKSRGLKSWDKAIEELLQKSGYREAGAIVGSVTRTESALQGQFHFIAGESLCQMEFHRKWTLPDPPPMTVTREYFSSGQIRGVRETWEQEPEGKPETYRLEIELEGKPPLRLESVEDSNMAQTVDHLRSLANAIRKLIT